MKKKIQTGHSSRGQKKITKLLDSLSREHISYLDLIKKDTLVEKVIHLVLEGRGPWEEATPVFNQIIQEVRQYPTGSVRTVVFGGGTGLSSIIGGEIESERWALEPFFGLKRYFSSLKVAVCMTDDGGSSGKILRSLPCIALGDIRRAALSAINPINMIAEYPSLHQDNLESLVRFLQKTINYRFDAHAQPDPLWNPLMLIEQRDRPFVPVQLISYLSDLGTFFRKHPFLKNIPLDGQCLGNLWLVAAIYRHMGKPRHSPGDKPSHRDILGGIHEFSKKIGAGNRMIYPASTTQGELQFLYTPGLISCGEHKSSLRHSSYPVQHVWANFIRPPRVDPALIREIQEADLIILAPGSLYTSIIPILQIPALTDAIRTNTHALKILGASFWAQRGETDLSIRRNGKEYYISDLIEAHHNNIPGGIRGLFDYIIVTDLHSVPGDILRNYALEGKIPIYLDTDKVSEWGVEPIKAALSSEERLRTDMVIQHDPEKFARVIKTLYVLRDYLPKTSPPRSRPPASNCRRFTAKSTKGFLCDYIRNAEQRIDALDISHPLLQKLLKEIIWNNREILPEHLRYCKGVKLISSQSWMRSTEWDNILGYFDPLDAYIKIHENLLKCPEIRLIEDLLIALGESLLGTYFQWKQVRPLTDGGRPVGKIFEIKLQKPAHRYCFLADQELRRYLQLAQFSPSHKDNDIYYMAINASEAFTPPGLLFGLLYAWYLNNQLGGGIEHEMSIMQWKISQLIPKQSMERARWQNLVEFFRSVVFRQQLP
ncbi:MAG: 2-phospho-L-lactate transferase CofD family protein [Proteobacteria bacterium]|nr:2-phospho-L-lactate transferase CofD family protein [Pseudomonadota bacterium]